MALHPLFIGYASSASMMLLFGTLLTLNNSGLAWPCGGGLAWHTKDVALERLIALFPPFLGMHHLHHRSWHL